MACPVMWPQDDSGSNDWTRPTQPVEAFGFMQRLLVADLADRYISRIRQPEKREYARAYLHVLLAGRPAPERLAALSVTAAKAVELTLDDYWHSTTGELTSANGSIRHAA